MRCKSFEAACKQAKANALRNNEKWVVFQDTNGMFNAERAYPNFDPDLVVATFDPTQQKRHTISGSDAADDDDL
jgi:hypothetical protein